MSTTNAVGAAGCGKKAQPGSQSGRFGPHDANRVLEARVFTSDSKDADLCSKQRQHQMSLTPSTSGPQSLYCHKCWGDLIQKSVGFVNKLNISGFGSMVTRVWQISVERITSLRAVAAGAGGRL